MFSSKSFIVSGLTFRSLIHFEFIFVCGVRECSHLILLHVADQFPSANLLKRLSAPLSLLASFVKDKVPMGAWVYLWVFYLVYISGFGQVPYCLDSNGCSVAPSLGVERPVSPPPPPRAPTARLP